MEQQQALQHGSSCNCSQTPSCCIPSESSSWLPKALLTAVAEERAGERRRVCYRWAPTAPHRQGLGADGRLGWDVWEAAVAG